MNLRDRSENKIIVNNRDIMTMTLEDFRNLPFRENKDKNKPYTSLVILPAHQEDELHDSGFTNMYFIAVNKNQALYKLSGISDVLHIDGICAFTLKKNNAWNIDCLPVSKLLHLWCRKNIIDNGELSSFEIFVEGDEQ